MAETTSNSYYKLIWDVRGQALPRVDLNLLSYRAAVSVGDRVYIVSSIVSGDLSDVVYEYLSTTGECRALPRCGVSGCALANVRGKLTTVGGDRRDGRPPHCLCWDETSSSWESRYPPLPQSGFHVRSRPLVATTVNHLITIRSTGDVVRVMDINTRLWSTVACLSTQLTDNLSVEICNGAVYVSSYANPSIFHCSLDALLHSAQYMWQVTVYPDLSYSGPNLVTVNNKLLCIWKETISLYEEEKKRFLSVESIPDLSDGFDPSVTCGLPGGRILMCSSTGTIVVGKLSSPAEEEEKHLEAFRAVMEQKGSLEQTIMHCLLFGYPGVGKSSLLKRLRGHPPDPALPSTGVAEKAVQVEVRRLTTTTAMAFHTMSQHGAASKWCTLSYDDEAIALMSTASRGIIAGIARPTTSHDSSPATFTPSREATGEGSNQAMPMGTPEPTDSPTCTDFAVTKSTGVVETLVQRHSSIHLEPAVPSTSSDVETDDPSTHALMPSMEVLKQAIKQTGLKEVKQYLQRSLTLYITDTGGQLEFQELLPALTAGPTLFFLVFRLDQDLDETVSIQFRYPDGHTSEPYQSSFIVRETLLQSLASIASMGSYVYSKKQGEQVLLKPKVIFIGTHLDKVSSKKMKLIDRQLQKMVKATSLYHEGLIERASKSQLMVAVNNLSADDAHFQCVQSIVERIADRDNFRVSLPSTWLIFSLVIRRLKRRIITYAECFTIGLQYGIDSKEELNEVLWFLNTKVGLVRHFRGEGLEDLQDIVIVDPQVIFTKITRLIVNTFTDEHVTANVCDEFKSKGIFPRSVLERMSVEDEDYQLLTVDLFVTLLEHLHIISRLHTEEVKYFMPCTLAHTQSTAPELTLSSSAAPSTDTQQIPPLLVTFKCGYCPKGLFSALVVYLLASKMKSELDWELQTQHIFRNAISFLVGPYDTITLKLNSRYLEVAMFPAKVKGERRLSVNVVCTEVRHCVEMAIREVTSSLHYTSDAEHAIAFYCTGRHRKCHPADVVFYQSEPCCIRCELRQSTRKLDLPSDYQQWFGKDLRPEATKKRKQATEEEEEGEGEEGEGDRPLKLSRSDREALRIRSGKHVEGSPSSSSTREDRKAVNRAAQSIEDGHPSQNIFQQFPVCKSAPHLEMRDLGYVLRVLHDAKLAPKWRPIGQTLTVSDGDLDSFSGDDGSCLLQMVVTWLQGQKRLSDAPSWWRLVGAVADPHGGDKAHEGLRIAAMFRVEGEPFKFVPATKHAKETSPMPLLNDFKGSQFVYDSVDVATDDLSRKLLDVAHRWIHIGVLLGVEWAWLARLRESRGSAQQSLRETLHHWLNSLGEVTLPRLVEAVEHSAGGNNSRLADKIKIPHQAAIQACPSLIEQ